MTFSRQYSGVACFLFFLACSSFILIANPCPADELIAPDRNISVVKKEPDVPFWKSLWDEARIFAGEGDFVRAVESYSQIYKLKPNIEEANWEYCKVLLKIEAYSDVSRIIAGLLEMSPYKIEYLLAGGQVAFHNKDYDSATKYFGKAFQKAPIGASSDIALDGFVKSLRKQGKKQIAFHLLEQLRLRSPDNLLLLHEAAIDAHQLHNDKRARKLYRELLEGENVDDRIIFQAAQVFDSPGFEKETAELWEKYVKKHPDYLPFRRNLNEFYQKTNNAEAAIPHLVYLADKTDINDDYLVQAGTVYLDEISRPDKALAYFERYIEKHPDDAKIRKVIADIQSVLAKDFLVIVENDGAMPLWKDLSKVTGNRMEIYLKMADLLEEQGKPKELIAVLSIIYDQKNKDDSIALRIAKQYYSLENYDQALTYLKMISTPSKLSKTHYKFKGSIEILLGLEIDALNSCEKGLKIGKEDILLRKLCIELAGSLGLVGKARFLFSEGERLSGRYRDPTIILTYLDQLSKNYLFYEFEQISNNYREFLVSDTKTHFQFALHQARTLRKSGKKRKAEQSLRQILNIGLDPKETLFRLAEDAIQDKNFTDANSWYNSLSKILYPNAEKISYDSNGGRMLLLRVRLLKGTGDYAKAIKLIETNQKRYEISLGGGAASPLMMEMNKELCWLNFYLEKYSTASTIVNELANKEPFDPETIFLQTILSRKIVNNGDEGALFFAHQPVVSRLLTTVEKELIYQEYEAAEKHLQIILEKIPGSVAGKTMLAKLLFAQGKFDQAIEPLMVMVKEFPQESYFYTQWIDIETRRGRYEDAITILKKQAGNIDDIDTLVSLFAAKGDTEGILTLARIIWGNKQFEEALEIYDWLLSPTVVEILGQEFEENNINYFDLIEEDSFWDSVMSLLQSEPTVVTELMDPAFLINNRGNTAGKIVAEHFAEYSWQKLITYEYMARKAIFERKYTSAEQNYKRLFEEEDTTEGMVDLASIYGRFGEYRKEAQVYEAIQNKGPTSPELLNSIERNILQIRPQSTFDASFLEKDGRDGYVNISQVSVGTSFTITPALDKDIKLVYSYNRYGEVDSDESDDSNFLFGSVVYDFAKDYELELGGGAEKINSSSEGTYLYDVKLKGQLDEYFSVYLQLDKSLVTDTLQALKEQISSQKIEMGIYCETPIGLFWGGDFYHRSYSDGNSQNKFHGFSSLNYFSEIIQLSLLYDFQYIRGQNDEIMETNEVEGLVSDDLTYWNPNSFAEHQLTLHFQHDFLGYEKGSKRGISYYSIDNAIGYEDDRYISYSGAFNIFLEISPHFLLKSDFTFSQSEVFEEKGMSLALHYRW